MNLEELGWNESFDDKFQIYKEQGLIAGRIIKEVRHLYKVYTEESIINAEVSGHFHYTAIDKSDYPTIGDWVALRKVEDKAFVEKVLTRRSFFSRKSAGIETEEQVIASNIDFLCIVCGLDGGRNFNLRGIERYTTMAIEGGAKPVLILNKADLCSDPEEAFLRAQSICDDIPIHLVSALTGEGIDKLSIDFKTGSTVAFTGHSGVGKSSLINSLLGSDILITGNLRESDLRGKHTTTHKELFFLKGGAMVIDTPGMRELQLWGKTEGLNDTFGEIAEAAKNCRFKDCSHQGEPGCAVQELLTEGLLEFERYQNYLDMRAELQYLESRVSERGRLERKAKEKDLSKNIRHFYKNK